VQYETLGKLHGFLFRLTSRRKFWPWRGLEVKLLALTTASDRAQYFGIDLGLGVKARGGSMGQRGMPPTPMPGPHCPPRDVYVNFLLSIHARINQ